ncbi:adenylosuccinate synthetase, putative [Plasmodium knowlesi strain H]|uniref:Adenylosuccinate synthetase n=4 Tax=Plasmodium knowlesi TaxID=5850 RepID=PURA_PLAKH|nr:adenylosuccinate synthetase, putative [Plasmodium knowlesi strain H]B3L781.1 RecName: Full=Adenylosuccinate synthetase; Short=AMPSase; Short=AdSS; AltName: Full=IMP--aspartate ligase [Plasmodium knowlesi strain H]OTN64414.1 Adenylosuccinate synthetase [Plasmodium knowlesi]CAA9989001.1 adenylosuccinate synthetase, putative [Plasmodium knowlesi strain H]SBO24845.1 adenylosuccinate synthetase, putative [Plasmodium knowlesi strain H]SBO27575.1 adenylosuccinate synthetase, putative [Plasmodium k|eukprot:XP_002261349.1 adenylosuccinate synthetase, putative [Plasmodium knowlesi strain H]
MNIFEHDIQNLSQGNVVAILGSQWGDEGKGKIIDILSKHSDITCRFNGGANAGHTISVNDKKYALHLLPCGILYENNICVLGNGMVVHLKSLINEINSIGGNIIERLYLSDKSHILFDIHQTIDSIQENRKLKEGKQIGTTKRGIGPCYSTKVSRVGIRLGSLKNFEHFKNLYLKLIDNLMELYDIKDYNKEEELESFYKYHLLLKDRIIDVISFMNNRLNEKKNILIEGANAAMLDIDFGTYPYVTSSCTTVGGIFSGLGINHKKLNLTIGVVKSYLTRVGCGPFMTELNNEIGAYLREKGHEYGTTTKRPRRCGWLDIPMLLYVKCINSIDIINLTKLDVLSGLKEILLCVGYRSKGTGELLQKGCYPVDEDAPENYEPVYEQFQGWEEDISNCQTFEELPENAQKYVLAIEKYVDSPIVWIGVGPNRNNTITKK